MEIISIREKPEFSERAISYFQEKWASEESMMVYQDAISCSINAINPLPCWYILLNDENIIIGCVGLITNDFISRGELYPWLCALFIEPEYRNRGYARLLIKHIVIQTQKLGFNRLHLCTDLEGFYEPFGFIFDGMGYHPWGESSRVYSLDIK